MIISHRRIGELIALVQQAQLSPWVLERAVKAFTLLGQAEGRVHGVPADEVPLHEVGAVDAWSISSAVSRDSSSWESRGFITGPSRSGSGWVRAAHGIIPVPAPATAILLEGLDVTAVGPVVGEATTPTGAALLRVLSSGAPPARWRPLDAGAWGAGGRNPSAYPNALRLITAVGCRGGWRSRPAIHRHG